MSSVLPITIDDFKQYFCQDKGFEFQPYPTWKKTIFDLGDYCLLDGIFYRSTINTNTVSPLDVQQEEPEWVSVSYVYEDGTEYTEDDVVFFDDKFWVCKETTTEEPSRNSGFWKLLKEEDLVVRFPGYRVWSAPIAYREGDKVVGTKNYKLGVYVSKIDDNYYAPDNCLYSTDPIDQYAWELVEDEEVDWVMDADIERAMGEAMFKYNPDLVPNAEKQKIIALYLTAFFVVYDRQMANTGLNGSSVSGPVKGRTVGKMSVQYMESTLFNKHPAYEFFSRNMYGVKAFNLLLPYLRGNVLVLRGRVSAE